jgi:glutathione synthase
MLPLDAASAGGQEGRRIVGNEDASANWILKASLDGGGHNVYGADIPRFLQGVDKKKWGNHILQERIRPPKVSNFLLTANGEYEGPVVSELGIFGAVLWVRGPGGKLRIESNENAGWTFEAQPAHEDDCDMKQGNGCYDSPRLID